MKPYLNRSNFKNLFWLAIGATLFFTSFAVGESTAIGGIMHLSGCACFCCGIHRRWCHEICEEECKHK